MYATVSRTMHFATFSILALTALFSTHGLALNRLHDETSENDGYDLENDIADGSRLNKRNILFLLPKRVPDADEDEQDEPTSEQIAERDAFRRWRLRQGRRLD
jgi:hypothetical protein